MTAAHTVPVLHAEPTRITVAHWGRLHEGELFAKTRYIDWAVLMKRSFGLDVLRSTSASTPRPHSSTPLRRQPSPARDQGVTQDPGHIGRPATYLLSGIARCGQCGGPLAVSNGRDGSKPIKVYSCSYHRERGDTVCTNTLRRPVDAVHQVVVDWIKANVLTEEIVLEVMKEIRRGLAERTDATDAEVPQLEKDVSKLQAEIERLVDVLASSSQKHDAIMQGITDRQERLSTLDARLRVAKAIPRAMEINGHEAQVRERLNDLRAMLERNPEEAKRVMRAIFDEPLRLIPVDLPEGRRFQIEAMREAA